MNDPSQADGLTPSMSGSKVTPGAIFGDYHIKARIGAGGMGEVYLAWDAKLKRDVAIKALPDAFTEDSDRVSRFQREAEVLASLNHPHIAAIYDLARFERTQFLVMELVDGETLAERIARGPIPIEESLAFARQIAEGLEAAHEKSIIHRDLKPANIKITRNGVKILDFGLAKVRDEEPADLSRTPTRMTASGMIVGTVAYMSPEQARGANVDRRTDIFAFGSVVYEMLAGKPAFGGNTASDLLAAVLKTEPDWNALAADLHPRVLDLLKRCLEKDERRRWRDIGDVSVEIERIMTAPPESAPSPSPSPVVRARWKRWIPILAAAALAAAAAWTLKPSAPTPIIRSQIVLPADQRFTAANGRQIIAISPDGTRLVYGANNQLYLRNLSEAEGRPIPGAEQSNSPFFSPDGQWIGFYSMPEATIKKAPTAGGPAIPILKTTIPFGTSWTGDRIVFSDGNSIQSVSADGGEPKVLVRVESSQRAFGPRILGQDKAVLFALADIAKGAVDWNQADIVAQPLPSGERKLLVRGGTDARVVPSGHLVYEASGSVWALPFDMGSLSVEGKAAPVIEGVQQPGTGPAASALSGAAQFSFSDSGSLIYIRGQNTLPPEPGRTLALVDRNGKAQPLPLEPRNFQGPRFSPDGKRLTVSTIGNGTITKENVVWIYDLSGGSALRRLTFGGRDTYPHWSVDGKDVIFSSQSESGLFRQSADGTGSADRLTSSEPGVIHIPTSEHASSKTLAFLSWPPNALVSLWMLPRNGDTKPVRFLDSARDAVFSPDGKWLAYVTSSNQVYVQSYPAGSKYQITTDGGFFPLWSPGGNQLFYATSQRDKLFSVAVQTGASFSFSKPSPVPLPPGVLLGTTSARNYDITPDGKQFIVVMPVPQAAPIQRSSQQVEFVLNWLEELNRRVLIK
jgi:serine/threonine protein kinase